MTKRCIVVKVWEAKKKGQKHVTIPKRCKIKAGDYVEIKKRILR